MIDKILGHDRVLMIWQWSAYAMSVSAFHILEFTTTALYNPHVCSSDSFLINHSTGYTAAALTSWTEFALRFFLAPQYNFFRVSLLALPFLILSQAIRSLAMITAGESFNHMIQIKKKDNHCLVTYGIYRFLRHPSYVGFFYWSIITQLVLGNLIHAILLAIVSWTFFQRRIPFEEESLCQLFPDEYPTYMARTYMGIPFIRSNATTRSSLLIRNDDTKSE
jgi:protein-S-isoprenylcysteine O-methyltransferase